MTRRAFLTDAAKNASGVAVLGGWLWLYAKPAASRPAWAVRPPGALLESQFLGACLRCGLCVRACPYDTLKLAQPGQAVAAGTPYFEPREIPCEMCPDIPCVPACPSGALDHGLVDIDKARMGLAVLSDHESCLAFLGLRCEICYQACPLLDRAITIEMRRDLRTGTHASFIPVVHSDACTGCGKCEKSCPLSDSAIRVLPLELIKGKLGSHYRLGWEEKEKAGGSLIPEVLKLPVRRPEGGS